MIAILGDHRVDHHTVAHQTLFDDSRRCRGRDHAAFLAALAGALFALGHHHAVLPPRYLVWVAMRATWAMPAEFDPLAKRRCRPTGGAATASSFMVLVFLSFKGFFFFFLVPTPSALARGGG